MKITKNLIDLEAIDEKTGDYNIIIESPRNARSKYNYDPKFDIFRLSKSLPAGSVFPYDFGFIPSTLGEDGDPIDVLILLDESAFPGCLVTGRIVGAIAADQTENAGTTVRNDRFIAISTVSQTYCGVEEFADLDKNLITQIEHFFISYNHLAGKKFTPVGRPDMKAAQELVAVAERRFHLKQDQEVQGLVSLL